MSQFNLVLGLIFMSLSNGIYAFCCDESRFWYVDGAFGMAYYPKVAMNNSQTSMASFNLGYTLIAHDAFKFGIEAGVQSGNSMRFSFPKEDIDALGGVPLEIKFKPMLNAMAKLTLEPFDNLPFFIGLKGGVFYQYLSTDRESVNDVYSFSPALFSGIGFELNEQAAIHLSYQYVWGKDSVLVVNPIAQTAILRNSPAHHALLFGFTFNFT